MDVYLESGTKRVFACAVDWPGWTRSARNEASALEALVAYAPRYAPVAALAQLEFDSPRVADLRVVERVPGDATTDFGAPGAIASVDRAALTATEARRLAALVQAAWTTFDRVVAGAPAELRKGPRGGGRDRDKIVDHVLGAESGYGRYIGVRQPQPARADAPGIAALRAALVAAIERADPAHRWPARYAARRLAWHVLDHAWEIEDRSTPA
jgi:hypothetical protein